MRGQGLLHDVLVEDLQGGEDGDDVSIVDKAKVGVVGAAVEHQGARGIQPQPSHGPCVGIARPGTVEMQQVARILKVEPFRLGEDGAPGAGAAHQDLKPAHLHHAVDVDGLQLDPGRETGQPLDDGLREDRLPFAEFPVSRIVAAGSIPVVFVARVSRREGVAAPLGVFGDDLELGGAVRLPVGAEEARGKVLGRLDVALGTARPESGALAVWDEVLISVSHGLARVAGLQRACIWAGLGEVFKGRVGLVGEVRPRLDKGQRSFK